MAVTLRSTNFMLKDDAPEGKIWCKVLLHLMDDETDTGRFIEAEVLLDRSPTATLDEYQSKARAEVRNLLSRAIENL